MRHRFARGTSRLTVASSWPAGQDATRPGAAMKPPQRMSQATGQAGRPRRPGRPALTGLALAAGTGLAVLAGPGTSSAAS